MASNPVSSKFTLVEYIRTLRCLELGRLPYSSSSSSSSQEKRLEDNGERGVIDARERCIEERQTIHLPDEIIFNILLSISAKFLHDVARRVCKPWYNVITDSFFLTTQRQLASPGLLFQDLFYNKNKVDRIYYSEENKTIELNLTEIQLPFPVKVWGSVNGLVLLQDKRYPELFHVMNPVTRVKITLPPVIGLKLDSESAGFAISSSGRYKVVRAQRKPR